MSLGLKFRREESQRLKDRIKRGELPSIEELKKFIDEKRFDDVSCVIRYFFNNFNKNGGKGYSKEELEELYNYAKNKEPHYHTLLEKMLGVFEKLSYENMLCMLKPPYPGSEER